MTTQTPERLLTANELAGVLNVSPATVLDWHQAGTIPSFRLGRAVRFRLSEVETWLQEQRR